MRVSTTIEVALLVCLVVVTLDARGQTVPATAAEVAQLPKFCWTQFKVPSAVGDEYRMRDCGSWTNHYCGALVQLLRAKAGPGDKNTRMSNLGLAASSISYTENGIKDYPHCSIREHVAASKAEAQRLQKVYGVPPSKPKPSKPK